MASAVKAVEPQATRRVHCDVDDWDFDPLYTDGACPICGWRPAGTESVKPRWMERMDVVLWDIVAVGVLGIGLIALAYVVIHNVGWNNLGLF